MHVSKSCNVANCILGLLLHFINNHPQPWQWLVHSWHVSVYTPQLPVYSVDCCVACRGLQRTMPGTSSKLLDWGRAEWCRTETSRRSCSLWPVLSSLPHFSSLPSDYPPFGIFNRPSWGVRNTQHVQDFRTRREGNVCTHNEYPHVVSVCVVYGVRNFEKLRDRSLHGAISCGRPLFTDGITDGYGCGYGQMETCQHNLMGAIFFLRIRMRMRDTDTDTDKRRHSFILHSFIEP